MNFEVSFVTQQRPTKRFKYEILDLEDSFKKVHTPSSFFFFTLLLHRLPWDFGNFMSSQTLYSYFRIPSLLETFLEQFVLRFHCKCSRIYRVLLISGEKDLKHILGLIVMHRSAHFCVYVLFT